MFPASDLRLAGRPLVRQPGLSSIAVLALGVGIGLSTIMFSIIQGAFLRGLRFEDADRIVGIGVSDANQGDDRLPLTMHEFADVRDRARTIDHLSAFRTGTVNISASDRPERDDGAFVTAAALEVPRVPPLVGRTFVTGDDEVGAPPAVVLGYTVWRDRFPADPDVVSRTVRVNGEAPAGFYTPMAQSPGRFAAVVIRVAGGPGGLRAPVRDAVAALDPDLPVYGIATLEERIRENDWPYEVFGSLFVAFGAAAVFLATAGLYGVVAFSVSRRTRDIGVRMALGASRRHVLTTVLRQGAVEIGVGLAVGLAIAGGFSPVMQDISTRSSPGTSPCSSP